MNLDLYVWAKQNHTVMNQNLNVREIRKSMLIKSLDKIDSLNTMRELKTGLKELRHLLNEFSEDSELEILAYQLDNKNLSKRLQLN